MGNSSSDASKTSVSTKAPADSNDKARERSSSTASLSGDQPPRRRSSSAATHPSSFYVTPEEQQHTKTIYALLWPKEKDYLDEEFFVSLFVSYNVSPFLIKTFRTAFAGSKFKATYESFEDFLVNCSRTSSTATLNVIWKLTKSMPLEGSTLDWTSRLKRFCALLLLFSTQKEPDNEQELYDSATELADFYTMVVHRGDGTVNCDSDFNALQASVHLYSPQCARPLQVLISTIFFRADESPSFHPYQPPKCSTNSLLLDHFSAGFLAMAAEPLQGAWKCLYTMTNDGISFNRIVHHVLGYDGPTVILIKTTHRLTDGQQGKPIIFGVFCHERWRESNRFYGSAKNFLFTLSPHFRIYHSARITDNHFQFLASTGFNIPHGLGFGGSLEGFRLFIPDTLEQCTARGMCTTYEPGKLVFSDDHDVNNVQFEIEHLEVWGSGGAVMIESALKAQADHRKVLADTIDKARKVDKAQFFNNGFDREFLLSNTFSHQKEMQDRVEDQYVTSDKQTPAVATEHHHETPAVSTVAAGDTTPVASTPPAAPAVVVDEDAAVQAPAPPATTAEN